MTVRVLPDASGRACHALWVCSMKCSVLQQVLDLPAKSSPSSKAKLHSYTYPKLPLTPVELWDMQVKTGLSLMLSNSVISVHWTSFSWSGVAVSDRACAHAVLGAAGLCSTYQRHNPLREDDIFTIVDIVSLATLVKKQRKTVTKLCPGWHFLSLSYLPACHDFVSNSSMHKANVHRGNCLHWASLW